MIAAGATTAAGDYGAYRKSIEALIWGTLLFNWLLALVNAQLFAMSQPLVMVCEGLLLTMALFVVARAGINRQQLVLLCAFAFYLVFTLARFIYAQGFAPKPVRDMAIIFIFLALGFSYREAPSRLIYRISIVVAIIGLIEILFPAFYAHLFNVKAYYINTRGFAETAFWNTESDMFISSTRPGDRFFLSFTDWPRASSIFLEPVSLGNFIVISLAVLLAGWRSLTARMKASWIVVLITLLLISDSRYAFACSLVLIGFRMFLMRFPQQLVFLLFLGVLGTAWGMVTYLQVSLAEDNFSGRVFYTFYALSTLDISSLMGVNLALVDRFADSGVAYFIIGQSIFGLIFLFGYYSLGIVGTDARSRFFKNAVMIAFSLNLLISNSLFSIKVAAMMWFAVTAFIGARDAHAKEGDATEDGERSDAPLPQAA